MIQIQKTIKSLMSEERMMQSLKTKPLLHNLNFSMKKKIYCAQKRLRMHRLKNRFTARSKAILTSTASISL